MLSQASCQIDAPSAIVQANHDKGMIGMAWDGGGHGLPHYLKWGLGGLVAFVAYLFVWTYWFNQPSARNVSSNIAKSEAVSSHGFLVSYAVGYNQTSGFDKVPVVAVRIKNVTNHIVNGYVSFKVIFENPKRHSTHNAEAIFSGPFLPGYSTPAKYMQSPVGYTYYGQTRGSFPQLTAVILAESPGSLTYHEAYKASVPHYRTLEYCSNEDSICSHSSRINKYYSKWEPLFYGAGNKIGNGGSHAETVLSAKANTSVVSAAQSALTKNLQHKEKNKIHQTTILQNTAEAKIQTEADMAASRAERAAEDARLSYRFAQKIQKQVFNAWTPNFASALACALKINLSPTGEIIGKPIIVRSSGNPKFDRTVIVAVEQAAPFVPPKGLPYHFYKDVSLKFNAKDLNHG